MTDQNPNPPATVPAQREAVGPVKKSTPVVIALVVIVGLIGLANISSLVSGKKKAAPQSALPMRPATANPQQVKSFETQQQPRTEHWLLSVTYYLNPKQVSDQARIFPQFETINPLGLTITEFHENRMSVDPMPVGVNAAAPAVGTTPATGGAR